MSNTPQTEAQRLADELVHEATKRVCNVAMMPYSLPIDAAKELRRLDAIEQRYNEMMANPCPEWDNKAYMQAIANLRAQLSKAVAEEREACAKVCDGMANKSIDGSPMQLGLDLAADAIRARSNT